MKEPVKLLHAVITDCARKCSTASWQKDALKIEQRVHYEGLSFMTITLPKFSEDFFLALERRKVTSDLFIGWTKRLCLPAFLQGFTSLVFCQRTGDLLNEPLVEAIASIRQICNLFKKVAIECTEERVAKALNRYVHTDGSLGPHPAIDDINMSSFKEVSRMVISYIFGDEVSSDELLPHHGPGSTAEKITNNGKYVVGDFCWYRSLDDQFSKDIMFSSEENYCLSRTEIPISSDESTVRVITVPKTLKAPRTIAMEPVIMQMTQQSLKDYMVQRIESCVLTKGHINFTDQKINQRLALQSSLSHEYATLDMSDASDRIHQDLVWDMFSVNPKLRDLIFACRSPNAYVDSKQIKLNKFASMGSALCFPVMSLFFAVLLVKAWHDRRGLQLSPVTLKKAMRRTYIYGDDIIIPTGEVDMSVTTLTNFGNVVGTNKSFWLGSFRESCGVDAYAGIDITPVYVRRFATDKRSYAQCMISTVSTCNQLFKKGYYNVALLLKKQVESELGQLPQLEEDAEGLGWWFDDEGKTPKKRWNRKLHRCEVRTYVPKTILKQDRLGDYNALFKCLLNLELRERGVCAYTPPGKVRILSKDDEHLNTSVVPGALTLKRRWVRAT